MSPVHVKGMCACYSHFSTLCKTERVKERGRRAYTWSPSAGSPPGNGSMPIINCVTLLKGEVRVREPRRECVCLRLCVRESMCVCV